MTQVALLRLISATASSMLVIFGVSACTAPSGSTSSGMLGYGTPGVSAYMAADQPGGLQAELDRCRDLPPTGAATEAQGLAAACSQLHRTMRNQPGNSVR